MPRPPLVVIDPDAARRTEISRALTATGYEVVPVTRAAEALRFAGGLDAAVIVAAGDLPEVCDGSLFDAAGDGRSIVLLGAPPAESAMDDEVTVVPTGRGLATEDLCRKLHLVLIGREIGVDVDSRCEALVGDLSLTPLPDLLRGLAAVRYSGRLELERGTVDLAGGEVVAAAAEPVRGRKAFCRLSRLNAGPFRIVPGPFAVEREIDDDLQTLIVAAIEDSMGERPDPRTRVRIEIGPNFFAQELSPEQQRIVQVAQRGADLQTVLDAGTATDGAVMDELLRLAERGVAVLEEPRLAVLVVTDSTADLPAHVVAEHGIQVVPLKVRFGQRTFRDGVDLAPLGFYQMLETGDAYPSTEPPDADDFAQCYHQHLEVRDVVSVHISQKLSETYQRADEAAKLALATVGRRPARVEVVDSRAVTVALGYEAIFAARMAARGVAAAEIRTRLEAMAPRLHMLFVVDTLDYLIRGGRIGKARGWIGKLLGIKPILGVEEGEIVPVDRARGGKAAQNRLLELLAERLKPRRPTIAAVVHAKAPARADRVSRHLRERFAIREMLVAELGPVVGSHVGPGMVGVMVFQPTAEEAELIAPLKAGA